MDDSWRVQSYLVLNVSVQKVHWYILLVEGLNESFAGMIRIVAPESVGAAIETEGDA